MTKDAAQRSIRTSNELVNFDKPVGSQKSCHSRENGSPEQVEKLDSASASLRAPFSRE